MKYLFSRNFYFIAIIIAQLVGLVNLFLIFFAKTLYKTKNIMYNSLNQNTGQKRRHDHDKRKP